MTVKKWRIIRWFFGWVSDEIKPWEEWNWLADNGERLELQAHCTFEVEWCVYRIARTIYIKNSLFCWEDGGGGDAWSHSGATSSSKRRLVVLWHDLCSTDTATSCVLVGASSRQCVCWQCGCQCYWRSRRNPRIMDLCCSSLGIVDFAFTQ